MEPQQLLKLKEMLTYLDAHRIYFAEYQNFVALTEDRKSIFVCSTNQDGSPEMDDDLPHLNWTFVTAPHPKFLRLVNAHYGTKFRMKEFAGR